MSKVVKQYEYTALEKTLEGVRELIVLGPSKVDAQTAYEMRKTLREKNIRLMMVKNTLARNILAKQGIELDAAVWSGTTLLAWGGDSIKELSNAVDELVKVVEKKDAKGDKNKVAIKTAVADGQSVSMAAAMVMPTRKEAIGDILSALLAPASDIIGGLTSVGSQLASQIEKISEKEAIA